MKWYRWPLDLLLRRRRTAEFQREISFHIAERTDDLMERGLSRAEAMREARRRFGRPGNQVAERRQFNLFLWMESVGADIRYAVRALRHSPVFAIVAILSLGLGIGANTAIFSLYDALVLRSLPVEAPHELLQVTFGEGRTSFTNPLWEEFRDRQEVFSGTFAFGNPTFNLADGGEVRYVPGYWVSGDFFRTLGVLPVAGRLLTDSDDFRGCPAVAAISFGLWQREFNGALDAVGRSINLNGHPFDVVGVVEPDFSGVHVGNAIDVYTPLCTQPITSNRDYLDMRSAWFLYVLGRPDRDIGPDRVGAAVSAISTGVFEATVPQNWNSENQERHRSHVFDVRPAANGVSGLRNQYGTALLVLMGGVGAVLLIACANVANLLLARATRRQHEVAIRRAIGSGRGRLVRLLLIESLLLSAVSALVAVLFAQWASYFLVGMLSANGSVWLDLSLNGRVLLFAVAVATLTGLVFGLAPAWRVTDVAPQAAMRTAGRNMVGARGRFAIGKALVVGQLALSLSLVVGAGLLIGTLTQLYTVDTGFDPEGVLLVEIDKQNAGLSPEEARVLDVQILEGLRAIPGVQSASAALLTPISNTMWNNYTEVDGYEPAEKRETLTWLNRTSDSYFETMSTSLRAGRDFDSRDRPGSVEVAVINQTMATKFFAEPNPIGRQFRIVPSGRDPETYEVIGVVADTKYGSIDEETRPIAYLALAQEEADGWGTLVYQVRSDNSPTSLIPAITDLIGIANPNISIKYTTLAEDVAASLTRPRILAVLSGFFGIVALLLATIGLYGTLAYRVNNRRNEIGLRLALGAARKRVVGMVMGEVGGLVLAGLALGVAGAIASAKLLRTFLFGVEATDPATIVLSSLVLAIVAFAAGALPAWNAARLDPMATLRDE